MQRIGDSLVCPQGEDESYDRFKTLLPISKMYVIIQLTPRRNAHVFKRLKIWSCLKYDAGLRMTLIFTDLKSLQHHI